MSIEIVSIQTKILYGNENTRTTSSQTNRDESHKIRREKETKDIYYMIPSI